MNAALIDDANYGQIATAPSDDDSETEWRRRRSLERDSPVRNVEAGRKELNGSIIIVKLVRKWLYVYTDCCQ